MEPREVISGGSSMRKAVIIGGVAGGISAAVRLRRLCEQDSIILIEQTKDISIMGYSLPCYISGMVDSKEQLMTYTEEELRERFNLDIRTGCTVTQIDRATKTLTIQTEENGMYQETYDVLILATGDCPAVPDVPGAKDRLYTLKHFRDAEKLRGLLEENAGRSAVILGGSSVGMEMAVCFKNAGLQVSIVEKRNQVLPFLDFEMAQRVHQELNRQGVSLYLRAEEEAFVDEGRTLLLKDGRRLTADIFFAATGRIPQNRLAENAGFKLNEAGAVVTTGTYAVLDAETMTPVEGVYAIGSAIQVQGFVTRSAMDFSLTGPAVRQGHLVADHLAGLPIQNDGVQGTTILKIFDLTAGMTGARKEMLEKRGIRWKEVIVHGHNHPLYYPGADLMTLKIRFDPNTLKILSVQAVGGEGTDKRLDVLATAMRLNATIRSLTSLELACAPPYADIKDPVNQLGYAAVNISDGIYRTISWEEVDRVIAEGNFFLDVRSRDDFARAPLTGAVNIPLSEIRASLDKLPDAKDTPVYVGCSIGRHAYTAIRILKGMGYTCLYALSGGIKTYYDAHYVPGEA